jgi:hypothetical protein
MSEYQSYFIPYMKANVLSNESQEILIEEKNNLLIDRDKSEKYLRELSRKVET